MQIKRSDRLAPWLGVWLGILVCGLPTAVLAVEFTPPSRGAPGRREGGGTRDPRPCTTGPTLTALLPATNIGLTTQAYPRFFWFQPKTRAEAAEFTLYEGTEQTPDRTLVYKTTFGIMGTTAGVASLDLPPQAGIPALQIGKDYHWSVKLICDATTASRDISVNGWIQRVSLPAFSPAPSNSTGTAFENRVAVLAKQGLWFDTLKMLASRRCGRPDEQLTASWAELLRSVKLDKLTNQPLFCVNTSPPIPSSALPSTPSSTPSQTPSAVPR